MLLRTSSQHSQLLSAGLRAGRPQWRHSTFSIAPDRPKLTVTSTTRKSWKPNRQRMRRKMVIIVQLDMKRRKSKTGTECDGTCCCELPLNIASCCLPAYGRALGSGQHLHKATGAPADSKSSDICALRAGPQPAGSRRRKAPGQRGGAPSVSWPAEPLTRPR